MFSNYRFFSLFLGILWCTSKLRSQELPQNYEHLGNIPWPSSIDVEYLGDILVDTTLGYLAIRFDRKPAYVQIYSTKFWNLQNTIKIKGYAHLPSSYFDPYEKTLLIDLLKNSGKYLQVDLVTYEQRLVDCEYIAVDCDYLPETHKTVEVNEDEEGWILYTQTDNYCLVVLEDYSIDIYLKSLPSFQR